MRIACPACATTYDVPEERVPPGRVVRCARCETDWTPVPEDAALEQANPIPVLEPLETDPMPDAVQEDLLAQWDPPVPLASATDRYTTSSEVKHPLALRAAWAGTVIVLLAAVWLAYSARESVMHAWPPSVRAYAALGLVSRR